MRPCPPPQIVPSPISFQAALTVPFRAARVRTRCLWSTRGHTGMVQPRAPPAASAPTDDLATPATPSPSHPRPAAQPASRLDTPEPTPAANPADTAATSDTAKHEGPGPTSPLADEARSVAAKVLPALLAICRAAIEARAASACAAPLRCHWACCAVLGRPSKVRQRGHRPKARRCPVNAMLCLQRLTA